MEATFSTTKGFIVSEIELVYRTKPQPSPYPKITRSTEIYDVFLRSWNMDKIELVEQMKLLLLNNSHRVIGMLDLSSGGTTGTVCDIRLLFAAALKANACAIALAHNHPSGDLQPSKADQQMTLSVKRAGELLHIRLLDHLIITKEGYFSFGDQGCYSPFFS